MSPSKIFCIALLFAPLALLAGCGQAVPQDPSDNPAGDTSMVAGEVSVPMTSPAPKLKSVIVYDGKAYRVSGYSADAALLQLKPVAAEAQNTN